MPSLFKYKEDPPSAGSLSFGTGNKMGRTLLPNEDGNTIDVVKKFPWTLTPYNSPARLETPYIKLREFYMLDSSINQLLKSYNLETIDTTIAGGDFASDALGTLTNLGFMSRLNSQTRLYDGMYDHINPTGFEYILPYFQSGQTNINTWTHKSVYESIVYYQQKLAAFAGVKILEEYDFDGYFDLGNGIRIAGAYYNEVLQSGLNITTGEFTGADWATLAGAAVNRAVAGSLIPGAEKFINIYEKIAPQVLAARRAFELVDIALNTSMGGAGGGDPVIDKPLLWTTSQPRNFVVSFPLFNTDIFGDVNAEKTLIRNWELCYLLTYQNLYNKKNLYKGLPPVFYEITVPGIHYTKAGYVNDLKILNLGNTRLIELPIGSEGEKQPVNMPDAYIVTMSLIDFFMPSKNFLDTINLEKNPAARNRVTASYDRGTATPPSPPIPWDQIPGLFDTPPGFTPQGDTTAPPIPGGGGGTPGFDQTGGSGGIPFPIGPGSTD